ncbi:hypothetical protein Pla110_08610 [Polystyrenella longa]|uniref:Chromosome partition protein Smc n=1 Tax=Polystyrenella longa TaxID=2528007 RepID=A0A518CIU8_9PLAN|nr:hypothetical protein [Polystyrenella longa]QDU79156.1 hypothetical protein Pla110_08610 [Polystyrenella longa]
MENLLLEKLQNVRQRQRLQSGFQLAAVGMFAGNTFAVLAYIALWLSPGLLSQYAIWSTVIAGPILGFLIGYFRFLPWAVAASAVDRFYKLKDHTLSALEFSQHTQDVTLEKLQVADTLNKIDNINAKQVVPFRTPRAFPYALALLAVVGLFVMFPGEDQQLSASIAEPNPGLLAVAEEMKKDIKELEEWSQENEMTDEMKELVEQLKEQVEEMEQPEVDVKEALANISEMQAALAAEQAEYNPDAVNAQMKAMGAALMAADAMKAAAQKLEAQDFKGAADEFEKLENVELERKEAKAVAEKLKKLSKQMKDAGQGQLSQTTSEMSDALNSGQSGALGKASKDMANQLKRHSLRNNLSRLLAMQMSKLNMNKSQCKACQSGMCSKCGSSSCSGSCNGTKNSMAEGMNKKKSTSPSNTFGKATSGNLFGDATKINTNRNRQEIKGQAGDGPTETETSNSPEGREMAGRSYNEVYEEYQKISETVLDSEPIPLGHRQTIQRYFELIRPGQSELHPEEGTAETP